VLTHYALPYHGQKVVRLRDIIRFQIHGHVLARAFIARVPWSQGFSDQAARTAEKSIEPVAPLTPSLHGIGLAKGFGAWLLQVEATRLQSILCLRASFTRSDCQLKRSRSGHTATWPASDLRAVHRRA
jgi:hypothetical protein